MATENGGSSRTPVGGRTAATSLACRRRRTGTPAVSPASKHWRAISPPLMPTSLSLAISPALATASAMPVVTKTKFSSSSGRALGRWWVTTTVVRSSGWWPPQALVMSYRRRPATNAPRRSFSRRRCSALTAETLNVVSGWPAGTSTSPAPVPLEQVVEAAVAGVGDEAVQGYRRAGRDLAHRCAPCRRSCCRQCAGRGGDRSPRFPTRRLPRPNRPVARQAQRQASSSAITGAHATPPRLPARHRLHVPGPLSRVAEGC